MRRRQGSPLGAPNSFRTFPPGISPVSRKKKVTVNPMPEVIEEDDVKDDG